MRLDAFRRDFEVNGPSLARLIRTFLTGWQQYKHHPDGRIRARFVRDAQPLRCSYAAAVWAMRRYYRKDVSMYVKMNRLFKDMCREFGWKTCLSAPLLGRLAYVKLVKEEKRLAAGWKYEPITFYEKNAAASALDGYSSAASRIKPGGIRAVQTFPATSTRS